MGFGLPLVTTPVFGIAEQVRENVNGLFYHPGDVARLATQLARLVQDDALRARLGANAAIVLDSLPSFEDTLDDFTRIFREARLATAGSSATSRKMRRPIRRPSLAT
jgi:glycosyltransferase involved in cell wall biosynthesis